MAVTEEPRRNRFADTEPDDPSDGAPEGPRRILIALYGVFALAATARGIVQITTQYDEAPLAYSLSLLSGVIYIAATVGLVTRRAWSRPLAWVAVSAEAVGVVVVGILSFIDAAAFPHDTVWSRFGSGYGFFPALLPILGLLWLRNTSPTRASSPGSGSTE